MIEADCQACHSEPFQQVQDKQCLACHNMSEHAEALPAVFREKPDLNHRCATCHMEHNSAGDLDSGLIASDSKLCADCHSDISSVHAKSNMPDVSKFSSHPQFAVPVLDLNASDVSYHKVSLDREAKLTDNTRIKLNHKVHLDPDGVNGPEGKVVMQCQDCHQLASDFKSIVPISFDKDCRSCHGLGFDERLADNQVPHAAPDVVFNYIYAEYAKLFLAPPTELEGREQFNIRRKPGYQAKKAPSEVRKFTRDYIHAESRVAEKFLFTRTACHMCHFIEELEDPGTVMLSRYEVTKPLIPTRWMPASTFGHGAHEELSCESCHQGVRDSEQTTDVLLPGVENCQKCHAQPASQGYVKAECIQCHSYHDSLQLDNDHKQTVEHIVTAMNLNQHK